MKKDLRLDDLKDRSKSIDTKLLSVRVPLDLIERIDGVVGRLSAAKGEVVVALLNEGLSRYGEGKGRRIARRATRRKKK